MMLRLIVFFVFCSLSVHSQITIYQGDMPESNGVFTFSIGNSANEEPGVTGENYFWNYMDLTMITQDADTFVGVEDTPFLYQFFFNNGFLYPDYQADVALEGDDIDLFSVSATNLYNYYKNDAEGYRLVGIGATISGLPQSIQYDPIEWIYEFPLTYGNFFEGESFIEFSLPGLGYISQDKETTTFVDGWGNLSLPIGDFDVLRLKRTINAVDSAYSETLGFGFSIPQPEEIKYQWLAAGEIEPVLEVSVINGIIVTTRYKDDLVSSVDEFAKNQISLYPNPAINIIQVTLSEGVIPDAIKVFDTTGREIHCPINVEANNFRVNITSLSTGYYILQIEEKGVRYSERFIIQ